MPTPYKIQNKLMDSDGAAFQPTLFYVTVLYFGVGIKSDSALTTSPSLQRPMGSCRFSAKRRGFLVRI
jgi:hypothetical protein